MIETNRRPYDFAEGESELVSGFNIEHLGVFFAFLLIAEYGIVIFFRWLRVLVYSNIFYFTSVVFVFIIIRGFIPRRRYDVIINFC